MDRSAVLAPKIRTAFAPCSLAEWPTPLEEEPSLARALGLRALWLKPEDKNGGNKRPGLRFLPAGAPPDTIVVPVGSGGTAAGIALGVAWLGWSTNVVGIGVASRIVANRWRTLRLARKAAALIRRAGIEFSVPRSALRLRVVEAMGKGYGHPTEEGERARTRAAEHGVRLDPTYGAKALGFLQRADVNVQRVVFWHTFAWP